MPYKERQSSHGMLLRRSSDNLSPARNLALKYFLSLLMASIASISKVRRCFFSCLNSHNLTCLDSYSFSYFNSHNFTCLCSYSFRDLLNWIEASHSDLASEEFQAGLEMRGKS